MNSNEFLIGFGERIRIKRLELGFSAAEFSQKIGISEKLLHKIESGEKDIKVEIFYEIKKVLGASFEYLLGEE